MKPLIRNDDVCAATTVKHLERFAHLTDKHSYHVVHAITPFGVCWTSDGWLGSKSNREIIDLGERRPLDPDVIEFLQSRASRDQFAIHGFFHTHKPSAEEIVLAYDYLCGEGLVPTWFVPPFNEGLYKSDGLRVSAKDAIDFENEAERFPGEVAALHSWRYDPEMWAGAYGAPWWDWSDLERRLEYPPMAFTVNNRDKHNFIKPRIRGRWLDVGCNVGRLLREVPNGVGVDTSHTALGEGPKVTAQANAISLPFANDTFDTVVMCGVIEQIADWRPTLNEALRVTKSDGMVIGTAPWPGTSYGRIAGNRWSETVINPGEFQCIEHINSEHYYWEVRK